MSRAERELFLSPEALDDLTDIIQYTLDTWGETQMLAYRATLDASLGMILESPDIGFQRPAISERHRFVVAGQHLIAYRIRGHRIEVSRILHGRVDVQRIMRDYDQG